MLLVNVVVIALPISADRHVTEQDSLLESPPGETLHSTQVTDGYATASLPSHRTKIFDWFGFAQSTDKIVYSALEKDGLALYVATLDGSQETVLLDTGLDWAVWAPSGNQLLYWTVDGELSVADLRSPQLTTVRLAEEVTSASYSPTGKILAILRSDEDVRLSSPGMYLLDLVTGEETLLTTEVASGFGMRGYTPLWTEDSSHIVFLQNAQETTQARFGVVNLAQNRGYSLDAEVDALPMPTSPPTLSQEGELTYWVDSLDKPAETWSLQVDFAQRRLTDSHTEIRNAQEEITALRMQDIGVLSSSLYDVKYQPPVGGSPSSFFSHSNTNPYADGTYNYYCNNQGRSGHKGTDFAKPLSTSIYSGALGVVEYFNNNCTPRDSCPNQPENTCGSGFGNYVRVRHANDSRTYYAHMSQTNVSSSQTVHKYTVLGYVGSTGSSTGCHLHFEIRYPDTSSSNAVDPYYGPCNWITQTLWEGIQPLGLHSPDGGR